MSESALLRGVVTTWLHAHAPRGRINVLVWDWNYHNDINGISQLVF